MIFRQFLILILFISAYTPVYAVDLFKDPTTITLDRSYSVGMKTREVITITNSSSFTVDTAAPRVTRQDYTLDCEVTVLNLDNAKWKQVDVVVKAITFPKQGKEQAFQAVNVPILATRAEKSVTFTRRDGTALSDLESGLLGQFFVIAGKQSPDTLFGTKSPQKAGESWSINSKALAEQLTLVSQGTMQCTPENTSGKMTFLRVWNFKDALYQQVGGTVSYNPVGLTGPQFKSLVDPKASASLTVSYQLPVDTSLPAAKMEEAFTLTISAKQNQQETAERYTMTTTAKKTRKLTILSRGPRIKIP